jgi:hypothetical protein
MIVLGCDQGSPEWHKARVGIPSASVFDKILTTKGELSKSSQKLIYQLAGERIVGEREEGYTNSAMQRGVELEPEARALFELITGKEVQEVGMCYYDEREDRSCSPDGLMGDVNPLLATEGLEIKCPSLAVHVEYLLGKKLPTSYFQQVQGSLYITGLERWHFLSYYPGVKPFHIIVERDEVWITKLDKALEDFVVELEDTYKGLVGAS